MSTVGVIVEYNPLHNGHLYHLQQSKKITGADSVVAVMSGNFLQRGEPALADKWARAEMALRAGCDLVLELPVAYSSQPAQWFAHGSIAILDATGIVDSICFGSESGDLESLQLLASLLADEPEDFAPFLAAELKSGLPYPSAFTAAATVYLRLRGMDEHASSLSQPNHTLGLHYLIALRKINSDIAPYTVRREKSEYGQDDITDIRIASATALRKLLLGEEGSLDALSPYVPDTTLDILRREISAGRAPIHWESFARPLYHELFRQDEARIAEYAEVTEGLEHRIKKALPGLSELTVSELLQSLKTKRYTRTKLQRTLLRILLGHRKELIAPDRLADGIEYIRVLGFNERGRTLLHEMRKKAKVPVIDSAARGAWPYLALDAQASAVYALAFRSSESSLAYRDYTQPPIRL
ncbi:nucleotidyltransferase [Cohnella endophytica]|uniref:tRNA(Met) cytidine acetate ligase n=1 Tax=Cohnella endophytica TaxID=2419778 RepID=A0A494XZJ9_9BACL|nr:nucleotidyltransferase [Cohnella endophytica]RKP55409.1 nucleotidyltransferase [Cohnella endophytica]